jgi:hypothetical protein
MNRYLTYVNIDESPDVQCAAEDEDYIEITDGADEWVWQFANSPEEAIASHYAKHDQWAEDDRQGIAIDTY